MTNHTEVNEMTTEARAARDAYRLLRIGFTVAPILFGLDKFFNWTVHWPDYLAPWINNIVPGSGQDFMYFVGGVEIVAGLLVAVVPVIGAPLVSAWLAGIVVNLLTNNPPLQRTMVCSIGPIFLKSSATFSLRVPGKSCKDV